MFEEAKKYIESLTERSVVKHGAFTDDEAIKVAVYMHAFYADDKNAENVVRLWSLLCKNVEVLFAVHPFVERLMISIAQGATDVRFDYSHEGLLAMRNEYRGTCSTAQKETNDVCTEA